jgi:uncharacterized protein
MKYLLILLLVMVVIWAVKRGRNPRNPPTPTQPQASSPAEMITCAQCGLHLPQDEAVLGQKGLYCSTEHRAAAQDRNPA